MKIHQILTSENLTYDFYLSIISALEIHQPEELCLWTRNDLGAPTGPYYEHIKDRVTMRDISVDRVAGLWSMVDFQTLPAFEGQDEHFFNVHIKDLLAWQILYEEGGLLMDLDTLSIQDCTPYFEQCANVHLFKHGLPDGDSFNNAIMIAKPESALMWELFQKALEIIDQDKTIEWGDIGPQLLNNVVSQYMPDTEETILSYTDEVCVVDGNGFGRVREWLSDDGFVWNKSRILHIYRSCDYTKKILADTLLDETFIYKSKSPYARLVKEILPVEKWNPNNARQPHRTVRTIKTFHIPCLPHLPANKKDSLSCAYTQKTIKLASMLKSLGHRVIVYGLEGSDIECDEFVQVASKWALLQTYGERADVTQFYNLEHGQVHDLFYANAIREINIRKAPHDFLLCTFGWGQKPIADAVGLHLTVESGIGYADTFSNFRVFESSAWMHYVYGKTGQDDGSNYDCVIPNYFDLDDFEYSDKKEDYFLYLGRLIGRKGIEVAIQVAEHLGLTLKIAGQHCNENIDLSRSCIDYVGYADVETRKELLKNAKALFVPTIYVGPFEGVHVEAGLSGTPVITSDWGVFNESVIHGKTGYRCRTFEQYVWAARNIDNIKPIDCYNYSKANYSMERIKWMYEEYFDMLLDLVGERGWYTLRPDRGGYEAWAKQFPF